VVVIYGLKFLHRRSIVCWPHKSISTDCLFLEKYG